MLRSRRIITVALAVLLALSVMSCFTFAAPAEPEVLPEGYMVVNKQWTDKEQQEEFEYTLGEKTYALAYGVNAFSSIDEAQQVTTLPAGIEKTIVLAPGVYSEALRLKSDVKLYGPYFGVNPNNNPKADDYDPNVADWALHNGRSIDETKEAVFTAAIYFDTGCNKVTLDGIAFTKGGTVMDTARANESIRVEYNLKNLYFKDLSGYYFMNFKGPVVNRFIFIDSIRLDGSNAERLVENASEVFELSNSYLGNIKSAANVQFYLGAIPVDKVLTADTTLHHTYKDNRFENIGGTNFINFAAREAGSPTISQRSRVILEVLYNEFYEVSPGGRTIQSQLSSNTQRLRVIGNKFVMYKPNSGQWMSPIGNYWDGVGGTPSYAYFDISKNYFEGYGTKAADLIYGDDRYPWSNIGPNYFVDSNGAVYTPPDKKYHSHKPGTIYDLDSLKYSSADFDILNSSIGPITFEGNSSSRTATLNYASSGLPTFRFRGEEVTAKAYSDSACTVELDNTFVPQDGKVIYVKAQEASYSCTYAVTLSSAKSNRTDVFKFGDAEIITNNRKYIHAIASEDGIYTFPKDEDIEITTGATYAIYSDPDCLTNPIKRIKLLNSLTYAYLKIVAADGTETLYTIEIYGNPSKESETAEGSSQCSLLSLRVDGASVSKNGDAYYVLAKDNVKSIKPEVLVSAKATYDFYLDAACKYEADSTDRVKLEALNNKFFVRVTAEDGTKSKAIPVYVTSKRPVATYSDGASIPSYARSAVNYLNKNGYGVFAGDENAKLNPRNNITRYELAKVMVVLSGINVQMADNIRLDLVFDDYYDIQSEAPWAIPYIKAAYAAGLINGVTAANGDNNFDGSSQTTREQFTTVFMRYVATVNGTSVNAMYKAVAKKADAAYNGKYADQKLIGSWAVKAVKLATYYGYVNGDGVGFNPKASIIRADVAMIAYNYVK